MSDEEGVNALLCDFAEYYGIYDLKSLPGRYAATLAAGLRSCSRSYQHAIGTKASLTEGLLSMIYDVLIAILIGLSGKKNRKKAAFISHDVMYGKAKSEQYDAYEEEDELLNELKRRQCRGGIYGRK